MTVKDKKAKITGFPKKQKIKESKKSEAEKELFTEEEYLDREATAEIKSEYYAGKIVAMAGAQEAHNRIVGNLIGELYACLKHLDCQVYPSDFLLHLPTCQRYVYPDITVVCGKVELAEEKRKDLDVLLNPQIVVEVMSESTAKDDLTDKMRCYLELESLKQYVVVSSDKKLIILYLKDEKGETKIVIVQESEEENEDEQIQIGECKIKLKDIYRKVSV